ncbi:MAG: hypothetical protein KF748_01130 [Xanthobacteraceae bacterium]|nr:hypothetical protein [Xanthobacteraceae bacterium]MBX3547735.1 hypothetical protein [Xanthobacteraceae bacterium]
MSPNLEGARKDAELFAPLIVQASVARFGGETAIIEATFNAASAHFDHRSASEVVTKAEAGEPEAQQAIAKAVAWYFANEMPLPPALINYATEAVSDGPRKKKRGPSSHTNDIRDNLIRIALGAIVAHGLSPTQNREPGNEVVPSAAIILAQALKEHGLCLKPTALEAIWAARSDK